MFLIQTFNFSKLVMEKLCETKEKRRERNNKIKNVETRRESADGK